MTLYLPESVSFTCGGSTFSKSGTVNKVAPLHNVLNISTTLGSKVKGEAWKTRSCGVNLYNSLKKGCH